MDHFPVKIPDRTSSLFAPTRKTRIAELEGNLKRKASALSTISSSSTAWIDEQIEYQTAKFELYTAATEALRESFVQKDITANEIKEKAQELSRKRVKAATSVVNLKANKEEWAEKLKIKDKEQLEAYQAALANNFRICHTAKGQVIDRKAHDYWKKQVAIYQNAARKAEVGQAKEKWCSILKRWSAISEERIAAHIIPHFMGFENVAWQLGDKGDYACGYNHIWNLKNGIVLSKCFEDRFDKGELVIVSIDTVRGTSQRLRMVVLDSTLLSVSVPEISETTFKDYDGQELIFKGDGRPALRYLYWHYVTSILRNMAYGDKADIKRRFPGSKMWPSAGSYFRKSVLKPMAKYIGDYEVEEGDFAEGLFTGVGEKSEVVEDAVAAEIANFLANNQEGQRAGEPDSDSESGSESYSDSDSDSE